MNKQLILGIFLLFIGIHQTQAQDDAQKEVQKTIEMLFEGMSEVDTSKVRSTFHQSARTQTVFFHPQKKQTMVHTENTIEDFLKQIATAEKGILDERISEYIIQIDGAMASVWTPYKFYLKGKFSHCGVNAFHLVKVDNAWKIVQVIDTRRKDNCE